MYVLYLMKKEVQKISLRGRGRCEKKKGKGRDNKVDIKIWYHRGICRLKIQKGKEESSGEK